MYHFYDTLRQTRNCPTGGQRRPPLQGVVRFRRKCLQFCDCLPRGRGLPRPYVTTKYDTAQKAGAFAPAFSLFFALFP